MRPSFLMALNDVYCGLFENIKFSKNKSEKLENEVDKKRSIILLTGFGTGDSYLKNLKKKLESLGYNVYGFSDCIKKENLKVFKYINKGWSYEVRDEIINKTKELKAVDGLSPVIIGWSLGGIYARNIQNFTPENVGGVITIASPLTGDFTQNSSIGFIYTFLY